MEPVYRKSAANKEAEDDISGLSLVLTLLLLIGTYFQYDREMSFIFFDSDDDGYLDWVKRHPTGFVLNVRKEPDRNYVVLHRASCGPY